MNNFLETYKINSNDLEDFINIFKEDKTIQARRVDKSNLKTDLKKKKLSISCRAFIMFMTNNLHTKRNIQEIIIDKLPPLPPPPIIKEKVEVIEASSSSEEEVEDEEDEEENELLIHGNEDDDDGGYVQMDMDKWRANQKKIQKEYYDSLPPQNTPKFSKEDLLGSIEWSTLEKVNCIPQYHIDNVQLGDCYYQGVYDAIKILYRKYNQNLEA